MVSCSDCEACCCRLEVMLITDTGVPDRYIDVDKWGGRRMARLDDGWCSALDRNTMLCSIYEQRPRICRELEMGEYECLTERAVYLAPGPSPDWSLPPTYRIIPLNKE